jgi:hypothetical protein
MAIRISRCTRNKTRYNPRGFNAHHKRDDMTDVINKNYAEISVKLELNLLIWDLTVLSRFAFCFCHFVKLMLRAVICLKSASTVTSFFSLAQATYPIVIISSS